MSSTFFDGVGLQPVHPWLQTLHVAFLPVGGQPILDQVAAHLAQAFQRCGHVVQGSPNNETDVLFTTAPFGEPLSWREAPFFQARRQYRLRAQPSVFTMIAARPAQLDALVQRLEPALGKEPPDPLDFDFPGLAPTAYRTLVEQGRRGGPMLAVERLLQAQSMCLRILLIVGDDRPDYALHFDLVGSLARSEGGSEAFYDDIVLRVATAVSAREIGRQVVLPETISRATWESLSTPAAMRAAGLELGKRNFFTDMVRIGDLVHVPAVSGAIANQYSEGCYATWEPALPGLIATITGSARPVDKDNITDDELAVIVGLQEDGAGVVVRHVEGKRNDPPSSEAFEMLDVDQALPSTGFTIDGMGPVEVPVVRSKLHGHRGVASYDPRYVEFVPMEPAYSTYPVTCGTQAQARGIKAAFARAESLRNPADPRQLAFTLLPTHGVFIVEKWVPGMVPLQAIWEHMDAGRIRVESSVPQGPAVFEPTRVET